MTKKRRTRKQKEATAQRVESKNQHIHLESPTYSLTNLPKTQVIKKVDLENNGGNAYSASEKSYLRKDMIAISAASGIILAFDFLLISLLSSGVLKLNFLGY